MPYQILLVDDDPDTHAITRMALKNMEIQGQPVVLISLHSAQALLEYLKDFPQPAVILLDVVMEEDHAGLDAVKTIRESMGNEMVRILLRTGQPGIAPERRVIDTYDIDGYLAKIEMTPNRLYTAVRTALRNYQELERLQQHREILWQITQGMLSLIESQNPLACLQDFVQQASALVPSEFSLLYLEIAHAPEAPYLLYHGPEERSDAELQLQSAALLETLSTQAELLTGEATQLAEGFLLPVSLRHQQGKGFLYIQRPALAPLELQALTLLATQMTFAIALMPEMQPLS